MKSLSERHDDPNFTKKVKWDAIKLAVIIFLSYLGFLLTPLIAYLGAKYGW